MKIVRLNPDLTRDSNYPQTSLKQYCFELDELPSREWGQFFNEVRANLFSMRKRDAHLVGCSIFVDCVEGELPEQLEDLKGSVEAANERYNAWKTLHDAELAHLQEKYRQEQERLKDVAGKLNFD